jgi:hypothetical protein
MTDGIKTWIPQEIVNIIFQPLFTYHSIICFIVNKSLYNMMLV